MSILNAYNRNPTLLYSFSDSGTGTGIFTSLLINLEFGTHIICTTISCVRACLFVSIYLFGPIGKYP
jgi:hypothetical protein